MSSRNRWRVVISREAQDDFEDIVLSGRLRWGEAQGTAYGAAIREAIDRLSLFPYLGRGIDTVVPRARRIVVREHVVYYQTLNGAVLVVRILHQGRDAVDLLRPATD